MIFTSKGMLDEATLLKTVGFEDRPKEFVVWVEYRTTDGELVKRGAWVNLKESPEMAAEVLGKITSG